MPDLEVRILGPLEVEARGRSIELRRKKQRALLALLALHAGEVVSTDGLIDELWGETPPKAVVASLQNLVSGLRKALEPDLLITRAPGYVLEVERDAVDAHRFDRIVRDARESPTVEERVALLRQALSLWRGPPFADLAFEPFALLTSPRLEQLRLLAYEELIDAELALGRHAELLQEIDALVSEHPFDERLRAQLMVVLYRSGRQAAALDAYQETRRFLIEELGIEPSAQLREVEIAILRQDPALAPQAPLRRTLPVRKTVTVLFADLVDSTALVEQLDPEALRQLYDRVFSAMREALERHGGTVEKFIGDAALAVFGVPTTHEDDAHRALRAAVEIRERLAALSAELDRHRPLDLRVRIGVNTGQVFAGDPTATGAIATGAAVNVAKRLEEAAPPGEIALGAATLRLVRDAVSVEPLEPLVLKKGGALGAWRLVGIVEGAPAIPRRLEAPLVGRERELAQLHSAFEQAREERRSRLIVLVGEPGIGKTRLAREFAATLEPKSTVLIGECVSYGEGATWLPLSQMLRQLGDLSTWLADAERGELVAQLIEELIGLRDGYGSKEEGFWAVRELLAGVVGRGPLVVVFEDVHWAEPTLLDLIEYLGERAIEAPLILCALTRPELLESRPHLADHAITLGRLAEEQSGALVDSLEADLTGAMRKRVVEVAGGNPLFVEQLVAHADEELESALVRVDAVPPSIEALLASRLDLLASEERAVLQRASVVGREFSRGAVLGLSAKDPTISVEAEVRSLERKGFIRISVPGDRLGFHHVLVRDVAYAAIPKAERSDLHERLADWLEKTDGDELGEIEEIVGYHLEQAYRYRAEVSPGNPTLPGLAKRAGDRLAQAGGAASERGDDQASANLLGRANELLPTDDARRWEFLPELGLALCETGDYERAKAALNEAIAVSQAVGDRRLELHALIALSEFRLVTDPELRSEELLQLAERAIPVFDELADERGLTKSWGLMTIAHWMACQFGLAAEACEQALQHARCAGDHREQASLLGSIAVAAMLGPVGVEEGLRRCQRILERAGGSRRVEASVFRAQAVFVAMQGEFEEARSLLARATRIHEEHGQRVSAAAYSVQAATIELLDGDAAAAERVLREAYSILAEIGETGVLSTIEALLAEVLCVQGRYGEAEELTRASERDASPDDLLSQVLFRMTRAKALARCGDLEQGQDLAYESARLAESSDDLTMRGDALMSLAEVLRLGDRREQAARAVEEALRLYVQKGNVVSAKKAGMILETLGGMPFQPRL
jgi:class 3 adenylate cyclase